MTLGLAGLVSSYLDHLSVERGMSPHTIAAYRRDLGRYTGFLAELGIDDPKMITAEMINDYAASLRTASLAPASVARISVG